MFNDLSETEKERGYFSSLAIYTLRELEAAKVDTIDSFAATHELLSDHGTEETEYGFFALNWTARKPDIIAAFDNWFCSQRRERMSLGLRTKGEQEAARGRGMDTLRSIGALRVINFYPPRALADRPDGSAMQNPDSPWKMKVPAPYNYLPDLYESARKVQEKLDSVQKSRKVERIRGASLRTGRLEQVRSLLFPEKIGVSQSI